MKKLFPLAAAVASLALMSSSAMAVVTDYKVTIINGDQKVDVGKWHLELDQAEQVYYPYADVCRFFVQWENDAWLQSQANLQIDEIQTVGHQDCEENSYDNFYTHIQLAPGSNRGFDKFQQKRYIKDLILGEDGYDGELHGSISFNGGVFYGFKADPYYYY